MSSNKTKWGTWRIKRLLKLLELKAQGLTDKEVAAKMPISRATVSRELNSPQAVEIGRRLRMRAEGLVWSLIEKQTKEIEGAPPTGQKPLTPGQKLTYRGKLITTLTSLVPKQVEQKISQKVEVEGIELKGLDEAAVGAIVQNFMEDEARKLRQAEPTAVLGSEERTEEKLDSP